MKTKERPRACIVRRRSVRCALQLEISVFTLRYVYKQDNLDVIVCLYGVKTFVGPNGRDVAVCIGMSMFSYGSEWCICHIARAVYVPERLLAC